MSAFALADYEYPPLGNLVSEDQPLLAAEELKFSPQRGTWVVGLSTLPSAIST